MGKIEACLQIKFIVKERVLLSRISPFTRKLIKMFCLSILKGHKVSLSLRPTESLQFSAFLEQEEYQSFISLKESHFFAIQIMFVRK